MFDRLINSIKCFFNPTEIDYVQRSIYRLKTKISYIHNFGCPDCDYNRLEYLEGRLERTQQMLKCLQKRKQNGKKK